MSKKMGKAKIVKTSKTTGFRISEWDNQIVVIKGLHFNNKRRSNTVKSKAIKEVYFGCFEESTINRFNRIKIITASTVVKPTSFIDFALSIFLSKRR